MGLSPPTRGNRDGSVTYPHVDLPWSIPAHAGEPACITHLAELRGWLGSIPAHAGEPSGRNGGPTNGKSSVYPRPRGGTVVTRRRPFDPLHKVYPRPRGGTPPCQSMLVASSRRGLSPPTRGNPARTPLNQRQSPASVYPRPRGGTVVV